MYICAITFIDIQPLYILSEIVYNMYIIYNLLIYIDLLELLIIITLYHLCTMIVYGYNWLWGFECI